MKCLSLNWLLEVKWLIRHTYIFWLVLNKGILKLLMLHNTQTYFMWVDNPVTQKTVTSDIMIHFCPFASAHVVNKSPDLCMVLSIGTNVRSLTVLKIHSLLSIFTISILDIKYPARKSWNSLCGSVSHVGCLWSLAFRGDMSPWSNPRFRSSAHLCSTSLWNTLYATIRNSFVKIIPEMQQN